MVTGRLVHSARRWAHEIYNFGGLPGGIISVSFALLVAWTFQHVDVLWRALGWFGATAGAIIACFFTLAGLAEWERYRYQIARRKAIEQGQNSAGAQGRASEIVSATGSYREIIALAIDERWSNLVFGDVIRTNAHYWLLRPHLSWQFEEMIRPGKNALLADEGGVQVPKLALALAKELDAIDRKFGISRPSARAEARALRLFQEGEVNI